MCQTRFRNAWHSCKRARAAAEQVMGLPKNPKLLAPLLALPLNQSRTRAPGLRMRLTPRRHSRNQRHPPIQYIRRRQNPPSDEQSRQRRAPRTAPSPSTPHLGSGQPSSAGSTHGHPIHVAAMHPVIRQRPMTRSRQVMHRLYTTRVTATNRHQSGRKVAQRSELGKEHLASLFPARPKRLSAQPSVPAN